jgi:hypothetical protein
MVECFVCAVNGAHPIAVTDFDGLKTIELASVAYRCAEAGQPVVV